MVQLTVGRRLRSVAGRYLEMGRYEEEIETDGKTDFFFVYLVATRVIYP
jgi:hypothetical protein